MMEKVEIVKTKIYTIRDLKALLGEGKRDSDIFIGFYPSGSKPVMWTRKLDQEQEVLKIEIREPHEIKK